MDAGRKPYWQHCYGPDEMEMVVRSSTRKQRVTTGFLYPEKGYCSSGSPIRTQPEPSVHGTCLHMFCFLGNDTHLSRHLHR